MPTRTLCCQHAEFDALCCSQAAFIISGLSKQVPTPPSNAERTVAALLAAAGGSGGSGGPAASPAAASKPGASLSDSKGGSGGALDQNDDIFKGRQANLSLVSAGCCCLA